MQRANILIVGAGLAGLCCARHLHLARQEFTLVEAADAVGGRVRTDRVNGFQLDRGFHVFLEAYPEARRMLDYPALDLQRLAPGAMLQRNGRFTHLIDPWRDPAAAMKQALGLVGSTLDKLRLGKLRYQVTAPSLDDLLSRPEQTTEHYLRSRGFSENLIDQVFRPWFGGVFFEHDLQTSSRLFEFLFRMFAQGEVSLPNGGMERVPAQLAKPLPEEAVHLNTPVQAIDPQRKQITLASGQTIQAEAIVLATECPSAQRLLPPELAPQGESRAVTCLYFAADRPPVPGPHLLLNSEGTGRVNNVCVLSEIAPGYAPAGQALISVVILGNPALEDAELFPEVQRELEGWFPGEAARWEPLRTYRIAHALPAQPPGSLDPPHRPTRRADGLYACGDYLDLPSLQGAMASGRRAAEAVLEGE